MIEPLTRPTIDLYLCETCRRGWESSSMDELICPGCNNPRTLFYSHKRTGNPQKYYERRDALLEYLGYDPIMNPETMQELDFNPLQEVINEQQSQIESLGQTIEDMDDTISELRSTIADMESSLERIGQVVSLHV